MHQVKQQIALCLGLEVHLFIDQPPKPCQLTTKQKMAKVYKATTIFSFEEAPQ